MKPARFDYYDPQTLEEAVALLAQYGDEGKVLAGGQSLMPLLNMRLARPKVIVDINRIEGADYVRPWGDGVAIGLGARQRVLQREALVAQRLPILRDAATYIGHPQIRSRGTICGSLAHADPAAELPALAVALEAQLVASSVQGERTVPAEEFYLGYLTTCLSPGEVLTEARFPAAAAGMAWCLLEVSRRYGDFALVGVVAGLSVDPAGDMVSAARLTYFGANPTPKRARDAERALIGQRPGDEVFRSAAELASRALDPDADIHATAEYRRSVAAALTVRALRHAWAQLGGG